MNNKGFTLIELLAVIIILSMLVTILSISVDKSIKNSKQALSNIQIDTIENSAQLYYLKEGINYSHTNREFKMCIDLKYLIENDYIEGAELVNLKNEKNLTGSVEITYESDNYSYRYKENNCNYQYKPINQICEAVTEKTKTTGSVPNGNYLPGDEYICKVKNNTKYHFFVVSTEGDNVNLIMDRNVYYDSTNDIGSVATANKGLVAWYENAEDNSYGPVTAMDYLHNATKDWDNLPNIIMNYEDENISYYTGEKGIEGYGSIKTTKNITIITNKNEEETGRIENLKTRLPRNDEVQGVGKCTTTVGSCPIWLFNYLKESSYITAEGLQNIDGIYGYWILSSREVTSHSLIVGCSGYLYYGSVSNAKNYGVRPVISIPKLDIAN